MSDERDPVRFVTPLLPYFDEIVTNEAGDKQFLDESGNNFPGTIFEGDPDVGRPVADEPGDLRVTGG